MGLDVEKAIAGYCFFKKEIEADLRLQNGRI
jgi:hypothetical protein